MVRLLTAGLLRAAALTAIVPSLVFALMHASGGSIAQSLLGEHASSADVAAKEAELGLDRPVLVQYFDWAAGALCGDFGASWSNGEPVASMLLARIPSTLAIVVLSVTITAILGIALGLAAALRGGSVDRAVQLVGVIGFSLPSYWIALMLVAAFALAFPLLPATGYIPFSEDPRGWAASLTLPVAAIVIGSISATAQHVRGAALETLEQDYVRTLRAHGLPERSIVFRHVLRGAAPPALAVLSLQFVSLLGGAVIIERVFAIPGLGTLTVNAATAGDLPVLMGVVAMTTAMVVIATTTFDGMAALLSPKARSAMRLSAATHHRRSPHNRTASNGRTR